MNDATRRFFSGDSLQQAIIQAANYFNLDPDWVAYKSIEKRHGFLKTRRKVVIEVDPDNPKRESPVSAPATVRATPPAPPSGYMLREPTAPHPAAEPPPAYSPAAARPEADRPPRAPMARPEGRGPDRGSRGGPDRGPRGGGRGDRGERHDRPRHRDDDRRPPRTGDRPSSGIEPFRLEGGSGEGLVTLPEKPRGISDRYPVAVGPAADAAAKSIELLLRIAGLDLKAQVFQGEERLEVDLSGEDVDWCFADDGEMIQAVEHLLPRMIRSLSGEPVPVRVDCDNFHEIREERLRSLAQKVAEEVRRQGKPRILEPMNPGDRRIIHVTLADDPGVATESEGDGYFKRVMVRPA
ncbi:MAG TPA: R3H domain-containing nucleic acid-binding protein [Thermoanaerobaculia bacterium]|jgi:spoIIIJ-associated protein|nr:R3H domain-containing nucleic acid-binding protein [Thermoanaerobaculia bacterium]